MKMEKKATKTTKKKTAPKVKSQEATIEQKDYYVIHKLRENEMMIVGEANQLVAVTDKKWIAEDICARYKFYNSDYEKLAYARIMTLVAQKQ